MEKICVIGGGSWGTTLANLLIEKNNDVVIYDVSLDTVNEINTYHTNISKLGDILLNQELIATTNLKEALNHVNLVVIAIPTAFIRQTLKEINKLLDKPIVFCNVSKGLELKTHKRVSEIVNDEINSEYIKAYVVLSGPSHAEEVIQKKITSIVSASKSKIYAKKIQELFSNEYFRIYTSSDVLSVELSGSLKNIFAIASGIVDGLGYGINTKAALITRGLKEMKRIVRVYHGNTSTLNGLVGVGDLIVTCTTKLSRNYSCGVLIGQGLTVLEATNKINMVVEGIKTCKSAYNLSKENNLKTPIIDAIYNILYNNVKPEVQIKQLMSRKLIDE